MTERGRRPRRTDQQGVALLTVLLAVVLLLILISAMLAVARNEILIAGLQRDSIRALEFAQSGIEEAQRRLNAGHAVIPGFTASVDDGGTTNRTHVSLEVVGTPGASSSFQEIRAESTVGRATRRVSYLVFTITDFLPPNIIFGFSLASQGSVDATTGDVYSSTFVNYKRYPSSNSYTYTGWGIKKDPAGPGGSTDWCYTHDECLTENPGNSNVVRWYPGQRRTIRADRTIAGNIANGSAGDPRGDEVFESVLDFTCPLGPTGDKALARINAGVGWQSGDRKQDNTTLNAGEMNLYGCDADNLPFTYVRETFRDYSGATRNVWFKTIVYNDWFAKYFIFDSDNTDDGTPQTCCKGSFRRRTRGEAGGSLDNLYDRPQNGAVPPFPRFAEIEGSLNASELQVAGQYDGDGANITGSTPLKLGCKDPEMSCPGNISDYNVVWLDNGSTGGTICNDADYRIGGPVQGHGTLVIDGDLCVNADFEYWGTVFVNGALIRGNGNAVIHGGVVVKETIEVNGDLTVEAGTSVGGAPLGKVSVIRKSWWER